MGIPKITEQHKEQAFEMAINGDLYVKIAESLQFTNKVAFHRYLKKNPEFARELEEMRFASADYLEDKIKTLAQDYSDPHMARIALEALKNLLAWLNPRKYGNKIDLNVTQTIDIDVVLNEAKSRVLNVVEQDPLLIKQAKQIAPPPESEPAEPIPNALNINDIE